MHTKAGQNGGEKPADRRQSPRLEVTGRIQGRLLHPDQPVTLLNMSGGGFRVQASTYFAPGAVNEFGFTTSDRVTVLIRARAAHATFAMAADSVSYLSGQEFLGRGAGGVELAIKKLMSAISERPH